MIESIPFRVRPGFLLAFFLLGAACQGSGEKKESATADSAAATPDGRLMQHGLALLYQQGDPIGAAQSFRDVLKVNPTHYGAHFQLAKALDQSGKPTEARPMWEEVLRLADGIRDTATARSARTRLAAPDTVSADAAMTVGLNLLYSQNNPVAAAEQFRKVLEKNPTHYGATYQLAVTLDRTGRQAEARPLWMKVLGMATQYKDDRTAQIARERLKRAP